MPLAAPRAGSYLVPPLQDAPGQPARRHGQPVGGQPVQQHGGNGGSCLHADTDQARDQGGLDRAQAAGLGAAAAIAAAPMYTAAMRMTPGPPPNAWTEAASAPT